MNKALSPIPAMLCLIIAFLSVCLAWMATEYLNLETKSQASSIRMEGRIKELEIKADNIILKLDEHDSKNVKNMLENHPGRAIPK